MRRSTAGCGLWLVLLVVYFSFLILMPDRDPKPIIIQYVGQKMAACDISSDDPHHQAMGLVLGLQVRKGDAYSVVWLCPAHYKEWTGKTVDPYMDGFR